MFENKTFSFVKHFKLFLIISAILVVTGVAGLVTLPFGVNLFNMDVDFLGGVTMTYDLGQQADTAEVENIAKGVLEGKALFRDHLRQHRNTGGGQGTVCAQ